MIENSLAHPRPLFPGALPLLGSKVEFLPGEPSLFLLSSLAAFLFSINHNTKVVSSLAGLQLISALQELLMTKEGNKFKLMLLIISY